ncbi:MAG TPA: hypothetical protein VGC84_05310 [Ilumatobacteraceae bacterium]
MSGTWLSSSVGVPLALVVMVLLFMMENFRLAGRRGAWLLRSSAVLSACLLVGLIAARFARYS